MNRRLHILGLVVLFGASVLCLGDFVGENSIGKRQEYLDSNGKYLVEWEAYTDTQTIVFELTVATTGFVGFGISPVGGMAGADIIIGGVHPNATAYFSVRLIFSFRYTDQQIANRILEPSRSREQYAHSG